MNSFYSVEPIRDILGFIFIHNNVTGNLSTLKQMNKLEKFLDKITPKVEVNCTLNLTSQNMSTQIISTLSKDSKYRILNQNKREVLIEVKGLTVGPVDMNAFFLKDPKIEKLSKIKSKIRVSLEKDCMKISSYEHLIATKTEKEVFVQILKKRMDNLIAEMNYY